jgi:hypothetical protein
MKKKKINDLRVRIDKLKKQGFKVVLNKTLSYTGFDDKIGSSINDQYRNKIFMIFPSDTYKGLENKISIYEKLINKPKVVGTDFQDLYDEII